MEKLPDYKNMTTRELLKHGLPSSLAEDRAKAEGMTVEYGDPYTLQVDLDEPSKTDLMFEMVHRLMVSEQIDLNSAWLLPSKSGVNKHFTIKLNKPIPDVKTRILYQALLGSDVKRELFSLIRHQHNDPYPILLIRPKDAKP